MLWVYRHRPSGQRAQPLPALRARHSRPGQLFRSGHTIV